MPEEPREVPFSTGPFLMAAFICEKLLQEADGVSSAIRIIDRITRGGEVASAGTQMEPFPYIATIFIGLKSGQARGPFTLKVILEKPSFERLPPMVHAINLEGDEDRGVNIITNLQIVFESPGLYWFDVFLNDVKITRIPLRVVYLPQVIGGHRTGGGPQER
jgi:hypothetical protein